MFAHSLFVNDSSHILIVTCTGLAVKEPPPKILVDHIARENSAPGDIRLKISPDAELSRTREIVVSAGSTVLDACPRGTNLTAEIIAQKLPRTAVIDLSSPVTHPT